jgi:DNA-binding NarL/FixJ family response regulator
LLILGFDFFEAETKITGCNEVESSVLTMVVRVMVVEDHEPFRRFICSTLDTQAHLQIVGEVNDGLHAVLQAKALQPDLIVLDIGLPGLNGIEAARRIRHLMPEVKIVFLSQESSADVVHEALRIGALGYVIKTSAQDELLEAIETVLQGKQFVSSGLNGL